MKKRWSHVMGRKEFTMQLKNKVRATANSPKHKVSCQENNTALHSLQCLRDIALQHAIKYRWDPVLGRTHSDYVDMLNGILEECGV